jgi:hypothetical protein
MKLKKLIPLSASVLFLTGLYLPTLILPAAAQVQIAQAQPRLRIAVLDFEYARECFKSLIIKASVLKIPLIPLNKGDFERFGSLLIKEG